MRLADAQSHGSENEEAIAEAFKEVMKEQEQKIMALEEKLHARHPAGAPGGGGAAKDWAPRFLR